MKEFSVFLVVLSMLSGCRLKGSDPVPGSCTIFSASIGDQVFFGNNEDYYKPKTYLWTDPGNTENYGCIYLGYKDYSHQGGINEKGLCFDLNALPNSKLNPHTHLEEPPRYDPPYQEYTIWTPVLMMRKAATVEEALQVATRYKRKNWDQNSGVLSYQVHIADATGDAAIISVGTSGELLFTRKEKNTPYLISTNFNRANPENALDYPCWRYEKTEMMLDKLTNEQQLSANYFRSILDSVHVEGIFSNTLYSNVFDLRKRIIYLYHWHQFNEEVVLHVDEELAKGRYLTRIRDLFSEETKLAGVKEYRTNIIWLAIECLLAILTTIGFIILIRRIRKKRSHRVT